MLCDEMKDFKLKEKIIYHFEKYSGSDQINA